MKRVLFIASALLSLNVFAKTEESFDSSRHHKRVGQFEVKVHPLSALIGWYSGEIGLRVDKHVTVGAKAWYADMEVSAVNRNSFAAAGLKGTMVGAQAHYFPGSNQKSGVYVGGALSYVGIEARASSEKGFAYGSASGLALTGKLGYQWAWRSGFLMSSELEAGFTSSGSLSAGLSLLTIGMVV